MKNGPLLFLSLFGTLLLSWSVVVVSSTNQLAAQKTHFDALENLAFPQKAPGLASRGMEVYKSLGCASCHTQQVRRPGYGNDGARGWGDRQSVARDYMLINNPPLGQLRRGPDLANFNLRAVKLGLDQNRLYQQLYTGTNGMPAYRFLFDEVPVKGARLATALPFPSAPGTQLLPSRDAEALATYLLSLKQDYVFPEAEVTEKTR